MGRPLPMGALPIRSSDIRLLSGAIGSHSSAGFVLPRQNAGLTEPLPSRRGSFFATHLRTCRRAARSPMNVSRLGSRPHPTQHVRATAFRRTALSFIDHGGVTEVVQCLSERAA